MKLLFYILVTCVLGGFFGLVMASTWNEFSDSRPSAILDAIVDHDNSDIIRTKLDATTNTSAFGEPYKLSGTLESIRQNISFYLQWVAFFALAGGVMLIVYNGLLLVISPLSPEQAAKVKKRMLYISLGVILATGFYFVLKIILAIYLDIFVR